MSPKLQFTKGHLFHMTLIERLPLILDDTKLRCDTDLAGRELPGGSIGYAHLKARRMRTPVTVSPGGVVADYVPFYLAPRSPMLFANFKGQLEGRAPGQDGIVYLVTSLERVASSGDVVLTNKHPLKRAAFTNDLARFDDGEFIDWNVMFDTYFGSTETDTERTERRQAEALAHRSVALDVLLGVAARTAAELDEARAICTQVMPHWRFSERPDWYF